MIYKKEIHNKNLTIVLTRDILNIEDKLND
jgi:hypothetical protein